MAATTTPPPWQWPIPRPLQYLFDAVPLRVYEATELPARSQPATSDTLPSLYVFATAEDARRGRPSFNPGCLKWQTYLRLAGVPFRLVASTNHASPTGALPFLLPPRSTTSCSTSPIPSSQLASYAEKTHAVSPSTPLSVVANIPSSSVLRSEAYQSLVDHPLRNAWLYALYLDRRHTSLLDTFYTGPASSSGLVRATLRRQLRHAAEGEILKMGSYLSGAAAGTAVVDGDRVVREAGEALEALAGVLAESGTGWFFGAEGPSLFDCAVFAYTFLMVEYMAGPGEKGSREGDVWLGDMVRKAGEGELEGHRVRILRAAFGEGS
ncbi:hypothetical protein QBC47DRAFT_406949 [Echria macrotheca]|uniref:Thioredoxin-like fold domain-containing protein n=1 Tax=Echria macrotheca TaxID=438768 RepID=A0AAJ0B4E7_9PEZI|nr:hypothetical protein QBC47DRAFT_406949 [Echria macrotheca]